MAFWVLRQARRIRCFTPPSPSRNMLIPMEGSWILRPATLAYASVKQLIRSKNWDARFFVKGLRLPSLGSPRSVNGLCCDSSLKFTTGFLKAARDFQNKASRHFQMLFSQNSGKFREFPGDIYLKPSRTWRAPSSWNGFSAKKTNSHFPQSRCHTHFCTPMPAYSTQWRTRFHADGGQCVEADRKLSKNLG